MPVNLQSFVNAANSAYFTSRDIAIQGKGENAGARLGNYIFSAGKSQNKAVMDAFKTALEKEYGVFGTHAFDTVLGSRLQMGKSLRACDVKETLSKLDSVKVTRFVGELGRQLDTNPKFRTLSPEVRQKIRTAIANEPLKNVDPKQCKSQAEIAHLAVNRLDAAIRENRTGDVAEEIGLDGRKQLESDAAGREPTGLRNLKDVFREKDTSIEDKIKKGQIGSGMRVNRSNTNPVLLDKLKTNGVEPGFIFRNDWSKDDTHGFMADIHSEESLKALEDLKAKNPQLRTACEGMTLREQIMLAGRAHPAGMAAVAEFVLERAVELALRPNRNHPFQDLAAALKNQFSVQDLQRLLGAVSEPRNKDLLKEAKLYLFTEIRDAVMSVGPGGNTADFYEMSPVFKHFSDRAIVKLDYNESTKFSSGDTASAGTFMRPERVAANRKMGQLYRFTSRQSADKISAGAVTEALANDLTRVAGVPAQELEIVRGKYSDGHPKIMLTAKFAEGYKDLEAGMLKDGRAVPPPPNRFGIPGAKPEPLGKYKAFFLLTADRDGIGKRGQNKGFVNGKFFAIDPGHSLEGNGKYLKVSDDLSFKDTYGTSSKPRFNNFSVFDDDTFFAKMEGVVNLRQRAEAGEFKKVFDDYRAAFDPKADGISDAEKALRAKIWDDINKKEAEFNESLKKILDASANNLALYDDLAADGPAIQQGAIETVANLEKLTSPTTWVSKKGKVALNHLEVLPETRVPWKGTLKGDNLLFICETKLSWNTTQLLDAVVKGAGGKCEPDALGVTRITIPKDKAAQFFASFNEEQVQQLTHTAEYTARKNGHDGLKEAQTYKPVPYPPENDPRPLLTVESLPEQIDFEVDGRVYRFPKIHYQDLITKHPTVDCPRNVDELRALLSAQVKLGREVLGALMSGRPQLFEPTNQNIVALTYALHATALKKGEFMYRGSFSIEDKNGDIARWLDKANDLYIRTSTHAKPYQSARVDGHLNMPRGYDVPTGAGGLLNGMRTFHFFTIPDADGLKDGGNGNGPKRRLFLKCETFGIFCSTAHAKIFDKPASMAPGMKTRGYRFGDVIESICHGSSLFASFFTPREAPGIRKENLTEAQKKAIHWAQDKLRPKYPEIAEHLTAGKVLDGAGINTMVDNLAWIVEHMPEDEEERAWITDVLDYMFTPMEKVYSPLQSGDAAKRIGNEIMIDAKDLL
ncbi:MAG: hypothetical protein J6Y56_01610 [Fibrobacterales bacterium]|nr:hypothetical protein [Fibrobacterales bacterium]